jgi:hypothetical protein
MLLPPAQYDHPPTIPVIERVLLWNELQRQAKLSDRGAAANSLLAGSLAGSFSGSRITGRFPRFGGLALICFAPGEGPGARLE